MSLTWNGDKFISDLQLQLEAGLAQAADHLASKIKENLTSNPIPSSPGAPPHDHGELIASIYFESKGDTARVGSNSDHSLFLEIGTSKMAPRPFIRPALESSKEEILKIIAK